MGIADISLGAFLHDIGKIYLRAYRDEISEQINQENKDLFSIYPEIQKAKHTIYGYEMINKTFLKNNEIVKQCILHHHSQNPPNPLVKLVSIADRISAAERVDYENLEQHKFHSPYIVNIFSQINIQ